tara:strand:+ start:272 stop:562 length:291 start_codon:yes stop_codon:yes gene_type:complete
MSHEYIFPESPELLIDPEWNQSISINTDLNYFYVPSIPEWAYYEYNGLLYEGTQYNWNEVDFRLSADLAIPEPSTYGLLLGLSIVACVILHKVLTK